MQEALFGGTDAAVGSDHSGEPSKSVEPCRSGAARMRLADRSQVAMQICAVDELVPLDHPVRMIWDAVCQMDLSAFESPIGSREFTEGRPANDVRVMVGLWLWAAVNNVAGGRLLERLCQRDVTYQWMCGGLSMNYHTLNDFRVGHRAALDKLFTATLGRLMHAGLVSVTRISQDGMRVRASAGSGSFHRRPTLEKCLAEVEAHLADLKERADSPDNEEVQERDKKREMALASNRLERVKAALSELTQVEAAKAKSHDKKRERPARASTTDPQARVMKMPNGGFNPAYNVQFASDPNSRAIVGVMVSNSGVDSPLSEPMREQVQQRTGEKVSQHLVDGGYIALEGIDRAAGEGVELYMPVPEPSQNSKVVDRFARRQDDTGAVADWRKRMNSQEAKEIYQQRASTSETINAETRTYRGLGFL
ncbi:MAG: transposase, partial [Tepidisphaeraceae bacterium]